MIIAYYFKRIKELGLSGFTKAIKTRTQKKLFEILWKKKALLYKAAHTWKAISNKHKFTSEFPSFFKKHISGNSEKSENSIKLLLESELFKTYIPETHSQIKKIIEQADEISAGYFDILGSGKTQFKNNNIPWHNDFKNYSKKSYLNKKLSQQLSQKFYRDITIKVSHLPFDQYGSDIKVPWELSRMQHLFILGKAYQETKNHKYAETFQYHVSNWIEKNPFLLGINWVCPMDVAIRATNLIWGFYFFKTVSIIPMDFWEKIVCSLYDHAIYLENNWEKSDKPNNHYNSDLIGYLYLCDFFKEIPYFDKQKHWVKNILLEQLEKQIAPDGTSYEGSTYYHKLNTEIFIHFKFFCETQDTSLPVLAIKKINNMITFLQDCTDGKKNLVQIGDNDSGKLVTGISYPNLARDNIVFYKNFGLTIIKKSNWHITFRHPTFSSNQPTGHFHHDQLSITVSIDGQPLIVDPGSYLYTANSNWRNLFRSPESHNSFFISCNNCNKEFSQDLFQLPRKTQEFTGKISQQKHTSTIKKLTSTIKNHTSTIYDYYESSNIRMHRKLIFDNKKQELVLFDWHNKNKENNKKIYWFLNFPPEIILKQKNRYQWLIGTKQKPIAVLTSTIPFVLDSSHYSPAYGIKYESKKLVSTIDLLANDMLEKKEFIKLRKL